MRRVAWLVAAMAPFLLAACADPLHTAPEQRSLRLARLSGDEVLRTELAPSRGDVVGLGGSLIGQLAAGAPGGALLGFSGQMAGGNRVSKAAGSTIGALIGSVLGPVGSFIGSLIGGYAGERRDGDGDADSGTETVALQAATGTDYIDAIDLGPAREKAS